MAGTATTGRPLLKDPRTGLTHPYIAQASTNDIEPELKAVGPGTVVASLFTPELSALQLAHNAYQASLPLWSKYLIWRYTLGSDAVNYALIANAQVTQHRVAFSQSNIQQLAAVEGAVAFAERIHGRSRREFMRNDGTHVIDAVPDHPWARELLMSPRASTRRAQRPVLRNPVQMAQQHRAVEEELQDRYEEAETTAYDEQEQQQEEQTPYNDENDGSSASALPRARLKEEIRRSRGDRALDPYFRIPDLELAGEDDDENYVPAQVGDREIRPSDDDKCNDTEQDVGESGVEGEEDLDVADEEDTLFARATSWVWAFFRFWNVEVYGYDSIPDVFRSMLPFFGNETLFLAIPLSLHTAITNAVLVYYVNALQTLILASPTPPLTPVTLYKVAAKYPELPTKATSTKPVDVSQPLFSSTTWDSQLNFAPFISSPEDAVFFSVTLPQGSHGLLIDSSIHALPHEREVLLPFGTIFVVHDITTLRFTYNALRDEEYDTLQDYPYVIGPVFQPRRTSQKVLSAQMRHYVCVADTPVLAPSALARKATPPPVVNRSNSRFAIKRT